MFLAEHKETGEKAMVYGIQGALVVLYDHETDNWQYKPMGEYRPVYEGMQNAE